MVKLFVKSLFILLCLFLIHILFATDIIFGTVNKSSQLGDSEVLVKQHSEVVLPWIEG
mgnify:CR=1 FL=1